MSEVKAEAVRTFETGANRSPDTGKYDYEGFLSPLVLEGYAAYMHVNRTLLDGSLRDSDNWQKGIPKSAYLKSLWRHFMDLWKVYRGVEVPEGELGATMGSLFNIMGFVHERIKEDPDWLRRELNVYKNYRKKELESRA